MNNYFLDTLYDRCLESYNRLCTFLYSPFPILLVWFECFHI